MMRIFTTFIGLITVLSFSQAQGNSTASDFEKKYQASVSVHPSTGLVRFIRFPHNQPMELAGETLSDKVNTFLEQFPQVFPAEGNTRQLFLEKNDRDVYNKSHLFYDQKVNDLNVFGGDVRFHFDENDRLTAVNGVYVPEVSDSPVPIIPEFLAGQIAMDIVEEQTRETSIVPSYIFAAELMYFNKGLVYNLPEETHLAYRFEIRNDADVREYLFIDAHTGKLIEQYAGTAHAIHRRLYETNTSNQIWNEGDALPGSLDQWQQNEVIVAEHTYNLIANAFGFISYDNADAEMRTINNNPNVNCPNATWNGTTANYCDGTATDDVIGHEWGHAYTEYTSGLIYAWQSGALNESYSDIWGETVDLLNNYEDAGEDLSLRTGCNSSDRWQMGEDATAFGGAIRDMYDPTCDGDPGKVSDGDYHCQTSDSGGVHINSGVNNHAYMLLVDGGTYNGQTVSAIGFTKAAHIFWRSQRFYLTNSSDFATQAAALQSACQDLIGINLEGLSTGAPAGPSGEIISTADCQEVTDAVNAVEMAMIPNCNFSPILSQSTPNLCSNPLVENNIFFEDFESGINNFTEAQLPVNPATWEARTWTANGSLPQGRAGTGMYGPNPVNGNCGSDLENGIIRLESPVINNPSGRTTPVFLSFDHYVATEANWDGVNLKYSINGGAWTVVPNSSFLFNGYNGTINSPSINDNPMAGEAAFTGTDEGSVGGSWGTSQVDLSSLGLVAGDNIQLRWEVGGDGCNGRDGWYIDDVQICTCETSALPVEMADFSATLRGNYVNLNWSTFTEINNAGFYLERKEQTETSFRQIAWIEGAGNSDRTLHYQELDKEVKSGKTYYYRLRQIDFDGKETMTEVVSVSLGSSTDTQVAFFPNPTRDILNIQVDSEFNSPFTFSLLDTSGKIVLQAENPEQVSLAHLPQGVYYAEIVSGTRSIVRRVVVE